MKIIGSVQDVMALDEGLTRFVSTVSPWIHDNWNPEQIGWIFILDSDDLDLARSLCVAPHCNNTNNQEYLKIMTIDLEEFDMWEGDPIIDHETGYVNVVGIVGQEYGFSIFVAESLVQELPNFRKNVLCAK